MRDSLSLIGPLIKQVRWLGIVYSKVSFLQIREEALKKSPTSLQVGELTCELRSIENLMGFEEYSVYRARVTPRQIDKA